MKTEEMADLLDGLASFLDRFGTKSALNDLRDVSDCFRAFPGETVAGFCGFVVKAKEAKASGTAPGRGSGAIDASKVEPAVREIRQFLDHRQEYDYGRIDELLKPIEKLKVAEIKAVGVQIGCPLSGKTKPSMIATLRNWLSDIRLSAHQSSFSLDRAEAAASS